MNQPHPHKEKHYFKKVIGFYFAPVWQSFFTILYFVFFGYFAIFHSGKIVLAFKFIVYTLGNSTLLLGLEYLFWGVVFLISLIIPFSVSFYALLLLYEVWNAQWDKRQKVLMTLLMLFATPLVIIIMDDIIRLVAGQDVLREFVVLHHLNISGK